MTRRRAIEITIGALIGVSFVGALLGILVTGPVVVPQSRLEFEIEPSAERLRALVYRLCNDFGNRDYRDPEGLMAAAQWIGSELESGGIQVRYQDYDLQEGTFRNVVGFRPGATDNSPVVVIGAHYDSHQGAAGADDNASGVAVLLELARTLPENQPRVGQYFVAFSTAEPPFAGTDEMGSYVFAKQLVEDDVDVDLMVALDMVGFFSDDPGSQSVPLGILKLLYPDKGNFLAVAADLKNGVSIRRIKQGFKAVRETPVYSFRAPRGFAGAGWSDSLSFWRFGLPGAVLTDTAFHRNPNYHTSGDLPDTLDYDAMARVVLSLHGVLWNNGGAPQIPTADLPGVP